MQFKILNHMKTPNRSAIIRERLFECIHNGELENSDLVKIFEHVAIILNICSLSDYARKEGISYQGALKRNLKTYQFGSLKLVTNNE